MPKYCLDSNIFIESKNTAYAFDIVPSFWEWIDLQVEHKIIYTTITVYDELTQGNDDLAKWIKIRRASGMFIEPDFNVQNQFAKIANYIKNRYDISEVGPFLDGADPWVIAQALNDKTIVVTHEALSPPQSRKIKIPNICNEYGVT